MKPLNRLGMDHSFTCKQRCLPLPHKHSPDGTTTGCGSQTSNWSLLLIY